MSYYHKCEYCLHYVDLDSAKTHVVKGSREYPGGPQVEPDETYTVCPNCDRAHDDFTEVEMEDLIEEIERLQSVARKGMTLSRLIAASSGAPTEWMKMIEQLEAQI